MTKTTSVIVTVIVILLVLPLVFIGGSYLMYQTNVGQSSEVQEGGENNENIEPSEEEPQTGDKIVETETEEFLRWGNIVNVDNLTAELVYEEPGKPALTVNLVFTMATLCVVDGREATCPLFSTSPLFEQGARVYVEGEKEGDIVTVRKITEEASN